MGNQELVLVGVMIPFSVFSIVSIAKRLVEYGKSCKKLNEKERMFATLSTTGTATEFTIQASKHLRFPNLSRLVKGKDKIVWCGNEYWFTDWIDKEVYLTVANKDPKYYDIKVLDINIEGLLQAQRIEAMSKPIIDNAKEELTSVFENITYQGKETDYPEGAKYCVMSYTLIQRIIEWLEKLNTEADT